MSRETEPSTPPRTLRIACCQLRAGAEVATNLDQVRQMCAEATRQGAELVCFPEATMVGFGTDPRPLAEPLEGPFATEVRRIARDCGVLVAVGMFTPADDGRVRNTVLLTDGMGTEAHYDKVHLYDAFTTRESERTQPGEELVVVEALGTRIGIATCYDVRFAEQFTRMGLAGAEVVLLPTAWADGPRKAEQFELLVRARAMDAQAVVVGCDQAFDASARLSFGVGRSTVAGPLGEVLAQAGAEPELMLVTVELDRVGEVRATVPVLAAQRMV